MEQITIKLVGTHPLMMHSDKLANPLAPETKLHKELTSKRKKTDDDHRAIAKSEFIAGCYWDETNGFYIPGGNVEATFLAGAKLQKMGTAWKRGALVLENKVKLLHDAPKTPDALWESLPNRDCRGVKVGTAKIMRYRPVFLNWAAEVTVNLNLEVIDLRDAKKAIEDAGALIGLCEYRPRYGRFQVTYD